ncbi:MAG: hypothetical protein GY866_25005 [Proteobacteria bacterium]|nr:hypothetical protein [Pseudomonadota bacterium]
MEIKEYYNDLMARMEELFYHELSDCAAWKTEFIGVDFIQSKEIEGSTREEIIENSCRAIIDAGLVKEISYAVAGRDILLYLKIKSCLHMSKEVRLKQRNIEVYNCPITNMILDQLIEKLNYETTYIADIDVDEKTDQCTLKVAIYETPEKIGCVSDWSEECRAIEENNQWKTISA